MRVAIHLFALVATPLAAQEQEGRRPNDTFLGPATPNRAAQAPTPADAQRILAARITRHLAKHWREKPSAQDSSTASLVRFRLNLDGTLAAEPEVIRQDGAPDGDAARRHAADALATIRDAAPFDLPPAYHAVWRTLTFRFDARLAR